MTDLMVQNGSDSARDTRLRHTDFATLAMFINAMRHRIDGRQGGIPKITQMVRDSYHDHERLATVAECSVEAALNHADIDWRRTQANQKQLPQSPPDWEEITELSRAEIRNGGAYVSHS